MPPVLPNRRALDLLGIQLPIIQAPMAGSTFAEMAIAVAEAGGLGSLPCASLSADQLRAEWRSIRQRTSRPVNLNFFCYKPPSEADAGARAERWRRRLDAYYVELGIEEAAAGAPPTNRAPFDEATCALVCDELRPPIVSFHFGLPDEALLARVRASGAKILSSATTVAEARDLEDHGCDAIIAQGFEAGGHRGVFLDESIANQVGTMALVPQVVDAVKVPVIAAGGIGDARGIAAAFALGASAVQLGTAYLFCHEARLSAPYARALREARDDSTVLTNVFTGRPARGVVNRLVREVGPLSNEAPAFPSASGAVGPLRTRAESDGSGDFSPLWAGQAVGLGRTMAAGELTKLLGHDLSLR